MQSAQDAPQGNLTLYMSAAGTHARACTLSFTRELDAVVSRQSAWLCELTSLVQWPFAFATQDHSLSSWR